MTHLTGEFPSITQSSLDFRPKQTSTRDAGARSTPQLLSDTKQSLPFHLDFWDGMRLDIELVGSSTEPSWHWCVFQKLHELSQLAPNWDSYGAKPPSANAFRRFVSSVLHLLPEDTPIPAIAPTRDGGLQLEWHRGSVEFEIKVPPSGSITYFFVDENGEREWEGAPVRHATAICEAVEQVRQAA